MAKNETTETPKKRDWKPVFLATLAQTGNIGASARKASVARCTVYRYQANDPAFHAAWQDALDESLDALEFEARRRGMDGSDALLMFLLNAYRPWRFRELNMKKLADYIVEAMRNQPPSEPPGALSSGE